MTSATVRRTASMSRRPATPDTCGRPTRPRSVPPPKSRQKNCTSAGVWVSASEADQRAQQRALARLRAADDDHVAAGAVELDARTGRAAARTAGPRRRPARAAGPRPASRPRPARAARSDRQRRRAARPGSAARPAAAATPGAPAALARAACSTMTSSIEVGLAGLGRLAPASGCGRSTGCLGDRARRPSLYGTIWRLHHAPASAAAAAAPAVRAGDVRGPEPQQRLGVGLEVAVARAAGQLVGVGHAEHDPALHGRERAQADPVRQVGVQPAQPPLLQPLRGQQQVHAERPADPADHHEQVDEVGLGGEQLAELVADDQQARQRGQRLARRRGPSRTRTARRSCRPPAAAPAGGPSRRRARPASGRPAAARRTGW